jgi:hypothetical protein
MKHTRTITWETPESWPDNMKALLFVPNDGSNQVFGLEFIEQNATFFDHQDGIVYGLILPNPKHKTPRYVMHTYDNQKLVTGYYWEENNQWIKL